MKISDWNLRPYGTINIYVGYVALLMPAVANWLLAKMTKGMSWVLKMPVNLWGKYYLRSGSTLQELKGATLDQFLLGKRGKHWDGVPIPQLKTESLSNIIFERFREKAAQSRRLADADINL